MITENPHIQRAYALTQYRAPDKPKLKPEKKDNFPVMVGNQYGLWRVTGKTIKKLMKNGKRMPHVPVVCRCGFSKTVGYHHLKYGRTTRCASCAAKGLK